MRRAGQRLAPILAELVPVLRRYGELDLDDDAAGLLVRMSAASIDRRLASARATMLVRGRSRTKPGSLRKSRIEMRTWAEHDKDSPWFVEVDLLGHEGGSDDLLTSKRSLCAPGSDVGCGSLHA